MLGISNQESQQSYTCICVLGISNQESQQSCTCICVLGISNQESQQSCTCICVLGISNQESQQSCTCTCVLGISILPLSTIFQLDFGTVPTMGYFFVFHSIEFRKYYFSTFQIIIKLS